MSKFKLLIYDLDGTLVDTAEDISRAINFMLAEFGKPERSLKEISRFVGQGVFHLVQNVTGEKDPKQIEKGIKIYRTYYGQHMLDKSKLYPGAQEFLEFFRGRKQAVVTNKPNPYSREILEALGVADYFVEIIAGDSKYPKKPDPAALLAMINREGVTPAEAVFIGDSPVDVQTGKSASVATAALTHGFSELNEVKSASPDSIAGNFQELLKIAQKEGW